jgi:hypothetical protein
MKPAKRGRAEVPQEHYGDQAQGDSRTRTPATTGLRPHPITPITQIRCTSQQGTARRASQPTMQSNLKRSQTNFRMLSGLRRLHRGLRWMSCTIGPWAIGKVNQDSLSRLSTATLNPPNASGRPMADQDRRWICSWSPPSISAYPCVPVIVRRGILSVRRARSGTSPNPQVARPQERRPRMKIETLVWMVVVLIGAALAGWLGALLVGVLWVGYTLGIVSTRKKRRSGERPADG